MSKGDIVASLGLTAIFSGTRIGFSLAVMRAAFHAVRRSSVRPSFLHTTRLVASTFTASQAALAIDHHVTGIPDTFEQIKSQRDDDGRTRSERLTPQQARILKDSIVVDSHRTKMDQTNKLRMFRVDMSWHAVAFYLGAGLVALRSGLHRPGIFRMIGGGCIHLQFWDLAHFFLATDGRTPNPVFRRL